MRVFHPLLPEHPLVTSGDAMCPLCKRAFAPGERIVLAPAREPMHGVENVPAVPLHATCALKGARTQVGVVARIKDGASPFPVVTEDGLQHTLAEAGLED